MALMAVQNVTDAVTCVVWLLFSQADMMAVSPGTQYTVTVTAASASSSNISPGVSRMINTNESGETCKPC